MPSTPGRGSQAIREVVMRPEGTCSIADVRREVRTAVVSMT